MYRVIHDFAPEALDDFRSLKGKGGHFERGLFIAESEKIARKIFTSTLEVPKALMTREHFEALQPLIERRADSTDIYLAQKAEMEEIIGYHLHQGVMLAVRISESRTIQDAARSWPDRFLLVALDGIADAENMGAIIRTAAAFGVNAMIVDDQSCNPYLRRAVRVSMGTIVDIELIRVSDISESLKEIKSICHCRIIGAAMNERSLSLEQVKQNGNHVLVFGSEGWGMREKVMNACDELAWIPMQTNVDSLNVTVASGILIHYFSGGHSHMAATAD